MKKKKERKGENDLTRRDCMVISNRWAWKVLKPRLFRVICPKECELWNFIKL